MSHARTVCILYGVNEGPAIGRAFERACQHSGFQLTRKPEEADITFTHSAGCFAIPKTASPEKITLIGVPYWPGRSILYSTYLKTWSITIANITRSAGYISLFNIFAIFLTSTPIGAYGEAIVTACRGSSRKNLSSSATVTTRTARRILQARLMPNSAHSCHLLASTMTAGIIQHHI